MKLLLMVLVAMRLQAAVINTPNTSEQLFIGQGVNSINGIFKQDSCVVTKDIVESINKGVSTEFEMIKISSLSDLERVKSTSFSISEIFSKKIKTAIKNKEENTVYKIDLKFKRANLSRFSFSMNESDEVLIREEMFAEFIHNCGDSFVSNVTLGHTLSILLILKESSESKSKELESTLTLQMKQLTDIINAGVSAPLTPELLELLNTSIESLKKSSTSSSHFNLEFLLSMTLDLDSITTNLNKGVSNADSIASIFSTTSTDLFQMINVLSVDFPQMALNSMKDGELPIIEAHTKDYKSLINTTFFSKKLSELKPSQIKKMKQTTFEFSKFINKIDELKLLKTNLEESLLSLKSKKSIKFSSQKKRSAKLESILIDTIKDISIQQKNCKESSILIDSCLKDVEIVNFELLNMCIEGSFKKKVCRGLSL